MEFMGFLSGMVGIFAMLIGSFAIIVIILGFTSGIIDWFIRKIKKIVKRNKKDKLLSIHRKLDIIISKLDKGGVR